MKPIVFENAAVQSIETLIKGGNVQNRIKMLGKVTPEIAEAMESKWALFDSHSLPRRGLKGVELDFELKNFRAVFTVPKLEQFKLEMTSELLTKCVVKRIGNAKKAKEPRYVVQFRVHHAGNPFDLLEWLMRVGGAEGRLELIPLQTEMFQQQEEKQKSKANGTGKKRGRPPKQKPAEVVPIAAAQPALPEGYEHLAPIPTNPNAPEWRTADEIAAGVPHHVPPVEEIQPAVQ